MNVNIEEMITLNYELEGLLYLALHRGNETPAQVWELISSKIENLREYLPVKDSLDVSAMAEEDITIANEQAAVVAEGATQETAEEQTAGKLDNPVIAEPEPESEPCFVVEMPAEEIDEPDEPEAMEAIIEEAEDFNDDKCDIDIKIDIKEEVEPATTLPKGSQEDQEVKYSSDSVEDSSVQQECICDNEKNIVSEPMRLDEKLARENYRNLKKAFSLNDRFRFRRELFNNSDIEMTETLDTIQAMASVNEALDYFYNDLGWDKANQDVMDFVDIITLHFSGK